MYSSDDSVQPYKFKEDNQSLSPLYGDALPKVNAGKRGRVIRAGEEAAEKTETIFSVLGDEPVTGKEYTPFVFKTKAEEAAAEVVPEPVVSHEDEAIIQRALEEAARIKEEALEEAKTIRENAAKEGYAEGFDTGMAAARQQGEAERERQQDAFREEATKALNYIATAKQEVVRRYLDELKDVAVTIAEKVILVSLKSSGDVIKKMITSEVEKRKRTSWLRIYIDKEDYNLMMQADADAAEELSRVSDNVKFIVMDREDIGHLIIETPEEITDVSVDTQMDSIRDVVSTAALEYPTD